LKILYQVTQQLGFDMVLAPGTALDVNFSMITSGSGLQQFIDNFPANITPPTDNTPFFFHLERLGDALLMRRLADRSPGAGNAAVYILGVLLIIVLCLTGLCILVPLTLTKRKVSLKGSSWLFVYFASIGLGFMMVEISQMQRLIVFLGHPSYSLSVVLFALLLSSGLGSYSTAHIQQSRLHREALLRLMFLLAILAIFGLATPWITREFRSAITPVRIGIAVGILLPLGFSMGVAFPLGMKIAAERSEAITPWLWGLNGATSVLASVMAVAIALNWGFSATFWTGVACYATASAALGFQYLYAQAPTFRSSTA
jgi:hypothetical protein